MHKAVLASCITSITITLGFSQDTGRRPSRQSINQPWPAKGSARLWITPTPLRDSSLKGLFNISDLVIEGIVETTASRLPGPRNLETDARLSISKVLKGPSRLSEISVAQGGGSIGAFSVVPQQYALMQPGERYILFLKSDNRPATPHHTAAPPYLEVGGWVGSFQVVNGVLRINPHSPLGLRTQYEGASVKSFEDEITGLVTKTTIRQ